MDRISNIFALVVGVHEYRRFSPEAALMSTAPSPTPGPIIASVWPWASPPSASGC